MKMSRSIKDYKDAMDSIKISDSFYKRTEVLLNESSEMEITKNSSPKIRLVSKAVMAAAACLLVAVGIKTVVDNRAETETAVVTEIITQETTVVTVPVTVPETASPVINRPEEEGGFLNDSGVLVGDMPEIPEVEPEAKPTEETAAENTTTTSDNKFTSDTDDDIPTVEEEEIAEPAPKAPVETTVSTAAREGYPEMAEPQGAENIPPLSEAATDMVSVEITPYFDMGSIKSGENPVTGSGSELSDVVEAIAFAAASSSETENVAFASVFLVQLSEKDTGLPYYSIYVTDVSTLVITRHDIDDQKRTTYELDDSVYDTILRALYNEFGNPNEYSYFRSTEIDN